MSEAPVMLLLFRVINLTVVGRLNFKKKINFFTKFAYDYNFMCKMPGIDQKVDYSILN